VPVILSTFAVAEVFGFPLTCSLIRWLFLVIYKLITFFGLLLTDVSEEEYDPMPPPGAGLYDIDSNMIVMNPDCDEGDEDSYNSDDYFFHGRQRAGEFETVRVLVNLT